MLTGANDERARLVATIYHALRMDYRLLPSLPKNTPNMECARDRRRAEVIATALLALHNAREHGR